MSTFAVKPLDESTWSAFARLVEKHKGIWGGCWCVGFHHKGTGSYEGNRALKEQMVREGQTHASLVFDGNIAVGWCQFGPTDTLGRIKHRKQYESELSELPDWRITCFFVDKEYRGRGVAGLALAGALEQISQRGGGTVESYPEDVEGRSISSSFIYNASLSMFERQGFSRSRRLGKNHWVVTKTVEPLAASTRTT